MKKRRVTNVAASVRQRLQNVAQSRGRPFQEVLQYYAMERFLYRLAQSPHSDRFVLKGALSLATAIEKTFANRGTTTVNARPTAFTPAFAADPAKVLQWKAFTQKSRLSDAPGDLSTVANAIASFLSAPAAAIASGQIFTHHWNAPGPWTDS